MGEHDRGDAGIKEQWWSAALGRFCQSFPCARTVRLLVALLLLGPTSPVAAADVRPLCANRPGKATPPCILDAGRVQFELGAVDASLDRGVESYAIANLVVLYGLTPTLEADMAGPRSRS